MRWGVELKDVEIMLTVGIEPHEKTPQRIIVNTLVEAEYPHAPQSIGECVNYATIHELITRQWPKRPPVELLETYVTELLAFIFRLHEGVVSARVGLRKPDIFTNAASAGVEAEWTREDFRRFAQPG